MKIGDKVKVSHKYDYDYSGKVGVIDEISSDALYWVSFENDLSFLYPKAHLESLDENVFVLIWEVFGTSSVRYAKNSDELISIISSLVADGIEYTLYEAREVKATLKLEIS